MSSRSTSTGFDCRGAPACFPMPGSVARTGGPGCLAIRRGGAADHAAGRPQNRSFNQAPRRDRGISPVSRCSNAFTPPRDN